MIPEFNDDGNLPPGIYKVEISEVVDRFGGRSLKRKSLTSSLLKFYGFLNDFALGLYIDGSYITRELSPSDVDLIVVLPELFIYETLKGKRLLWFQQHYKDIRLHVFAFRKGIDNQRIQGYLQLFQTDKLTREPKGIVYVELEND